MSNSVLEGASNASNYSLSFSCEIHVLLIERDEADHVEILTMLEGFSYKVTAVKCVSVALSILSKEKTQFDVVIADVNSCHSYMFTLLQETSQMDTLTMLMCEENNVATTMWALEHGAFLCTKKPVSQETIESIWQHVTREKLAKHKARAQIGGSGVEFIAWDENEVLNNVGENLIENNPHGNIGKNLGVDRCLETSQNDEGSDGLVKRKVWTEWTQELHEKFMDAVNQLGDGRCYPKEILEVMNIHGLTRMQVASHLQKCRNAKWIPPNKRKSRLSSVGRMGHHKTKAPRSKTVRFGSMPRIEYGNDAGVIDQHLQSFQEFAANPPTQKDPIVNNNEAAGTFGNLYDPQGSSAGNSYDSQLLIDNVNYPFANPYETLNMVPSQGLALDETLMHRVQRVDSSATISSANQQIACSVADQNAALEISYMIQNFSPSRLEFGMDYNGSFVQDKVQYQDMPAFGMMNASATHWGWD